MKQIKLLTIAILFIATTSYAQINKGSTALGGNILFKSSSSKGDNGFKQTSTDIFVSPSFMQFYSVNHAVGFNLNFGYSRSAYSEQKENLYGAGFFLRQYKSLGKGFYVFAQEALNFNYSKTVIKTDSTNFIHLDNRTSDINFTVNPGFAYNISKNFQFELMLLNNLLSADFTHINGKTTGVKVNNFTIGSNLDISQLSTLNVGAKIFFSR